MVFVHEKAVVVVAGYRKLSALSMSVSGGRMRYYSGALLPNEGTTGVAMRGVVSPRFLAHISVNQTGELTATSDFALPFYLWIGGGGGDAFAQLRK